MPLSHDFPISHWYQLVHHDWHIQDCLHLSIVLLFIFMSSLDTVYAAMIAIYTGMLLGCMSCPCLSAHLQPTIVLSTQAVKFQQTLGR